MNKRVAGHVGAALLVVGASATAAFGFGGSCTELLVESAGKLICDITIKEQGGGGGKLRSEVDGEMCFETDGASFSGEIGIPAGSGLQWHELSFTFPAGKKSKVTNSSGRYSFDLSKDDSSMAFFARSDFEFLAGTANNSTRPFDMKSKAYVPLETGFFLEKGKLKGRAKVFAGFTTYSGSFKAKLKGRSYAGKKVKVQVKLVFKSTPRTL